jgi:phage shock protein PspC (stress-responsive transcriptional regulator)
MGISVFEAIMLLCFGAAWPINIAKTLKNRSAKGKSGLFLAVLIAGYIAGITHKILYSQDIVMVLYIVNLVMVSTDFGLYLYFKKRDRLKEAGSANP